MARRTWPALSPIASARRKSAVSSATTPTSRRGRELGAVASPGRCSATRRAGEGVARSRGNQTITIECVRCRESARGCHRPTGRHSRRALAELVADISDFYIRMWGITRGPAPDKPVVWCSSSLRDLRRFNDVARRAAGRQLRRLQDPLCQGSCRMIGGCNRSSIHPEGAQVEYDGARVQ